MSSLARVYTLCLAHDKNKLGVKPVFEIHGDLACEHAPNTLLFGAVLSCAVLGCTGSPFAGPEITGRFTQHYAMTRAQILPTQPQENPASLGWADQKVPVGSPLTCSFTSCSTLSLTEQGPRMAVDFRLICFTMNA